MDPVLVVAYSGVLDSLLSTVARVWEVYGARDVVVVYSDRMAEKARQAIKALTELSGKLGLGIRVTGEIVVEHPAPLGNGSESFIARLRRELGSLVEDGVAIVSPTPGSRRLSMQLGLAVGSLAVRLTHHAVEDEKPLGPPRSGRLRLVHVDFCFGPWSGLYYPLVPRSCNPLLEMDLGQGVRPPERVTKRLGGSLGRILGDETVLGRGGLPPLRRRVAALAYWLNSVTDCSVAFLEGEASADSDWRLVLLVSSDLGEVRAVVDNVCDPWSWVNAVDKFTGLVKRLGEMLRGDGEQLAMFAGLERLDTGTAPGRLVVDTSLVYRGVHNLVYTREAEAILPQCLIAEITRAYAENEKKSAHPYYRLTSLLAYAALQELLEAGAVIAPSPPGSCDNAIPEMSPVILSRARPATADKGAYQYWVSHPATRRLTSPILVDGAVKARDPGQASYAVLQAIVVATIAANIAKYNARESLSTTIYLEDKRTGHRVQLNPVERYHLWSQLVG